MSLDEEGTLAALKTYRREVIDPKIAQYRGRMVKTIGDGALVEFASAVDATRCAIRATSCPTRPSGAGMRIRSVPPSTVV